MIDRDRLGRGDPKYFEELLRTHGHTVLSVARAFGQDPDHTEDLFQQTWVNAYAKRRTYRGSGSFDGWLHRVATNVCIGDYRARKDRSEAARRMKHEDVGVDRSRASPDPLGDRDRRELHASLHRALARLSKRELEAISLRIFEGNSTREAAERMRISPATVRSIIRHGIKRLRNIMEESGDELSGYRPSY